ncbi:hypothetical protein [uncultured Mediterranean phage uvDeep-CGR2-KM20-C133]|nr:hypothetical protein [uncultured Mediterranean phage uvDeep-CGR2-KM20-C133]
MATQANKVQVQVDVVGAKKAKMDLDKLTASTNNMGAQFGAASAAMAAMSADMSGGLGMASGSVMALALGVEGLKSATAAAAPTMTALLGPIALIGTAIVGTVYAIKLMYDSMSGATEQAEKLTAAIEEMTGQFDEFRDKAIKLTRTELEELTRAQVEYKSAKEDLTEAQKESVNAAQKEISLQKRLKVQLEELTAAESAYATEQDRRREQLGPMAALAGGYSTLSSEVANTTGATRQLNKEIAETRAELEKLGKDTSVEQLSQAAIDAARRLEAIRERIEERGADAQKKRAEEEAKRATDLANKRRAAWLKMLADEEALSVQRGALRVSMIEDEEEKALAVLLLTNEQRLTAIDKTSARAAEKEKSRWMVVEAGLHEELKIRADFADRRRIAEEETARRARELYAAEINERAAFALQLEAIGAQMRSAAGAEVSAFQSRVDALSGGISGSLSIMTSSTMKAAEAMKSSLDGLDSMLAGVGEGFAAAAVDALMAGASFSAMLKELAASAAKEAFVSGLMQTAKGIARLAVGDVAGSAAHFKAAAIFATVGGVAAGISGGLGGGSAGSSAPAPTAEPDRSTFDRDPGAGGGPTVINVNFAGDVYDSEYAASQALAARVTRAMNDRGRGRPMLRTTRRGSAYA